ncbi:MAG: hypothetical protein CL933_12190 [Deltaproteobacteria bacterium]|nr:hypothetical protein [Deltaproteobacteria bacterium]
MLNRIYSSRSRVSAVGAGGLLISLLVACANMGAPPPTTGYRANIIVKMTDGSEGGPALERLVEFYQAGKRRRFARIDGELVALIDRPDLRVSWMLNPAARSFEEYRISSPKAVISSAPNPFGPRARAVFEWLGTENVEGVDTQKYAVKGKAISGHAWLTIDQIPFRFAGTLGSQDSAVEVEIAYSEIERDSQAAFLFAIPPNFAGYEKRKQKSSQSADDIEEAIRKIEDRRRALPSIPTFF